MGRTSVYYAMDYIFSIGVFGFLFTILGFIVSVFISICTTGTLTDFAKYMWYAAPLIFLIFGPFWFFNKLREWKENPPVG